VGKRALPQGSELFQPMLASPGKEAPRGEQWVFEPKYDGIRIVAIVLDGAVALMTRNGHDKCKQFPEVTDVLRTLGGKAGRALVLDGEIVALAADGEPSRFQDLQGRMHLTDMPAVTLLSTETPAAFIAFDILVDGTQPLHGKTWDDRRAQLERIMRLVPAASKRLLRISAVAYGSPDALVADAKARGWEGIMAKRRDCPYEAGRRVRHWQKVKLENQQEFVVGGWTEPRNSRKHFGALLLGYYNENGELVYAGHTGTGFSDALLDDVYRKLRAIERASSPFTTTPATNQQAHWTKPVYVAQVRFNEWTAGGHLRQPVFLGLRDDKEAREVVREAAGGMRQAGNNRNAAGGTRQADSKLQAAGGRRQADRAVRDVKVAAARKQAPKKRPAKKSPRAESRGPRAAQPRAAKSANLVAEQLRVAPKASNATVHIDKTTTLDITNLGKTFFPAANVTKGRLMEYYAEVSPYLLPALKDRPLVLKRYPNGIGADAFYQQKAPDKVPPGIRVEEVADDGITTQRRLIGGDLATLLYIVQLGAVSTDPWHSRVQSIADADYSIVDLDPGPKATFKRVITVARWVKEVLDEFGLHAVPKTSGASGIHIVLPLPRNAGYDVSVTLAELVARRVNEKHPKETTVIRAVKARPADAVYVDYLQNIRGKTVASVYSARAETHASVSTPLKWNELTDDLSPSDFTVNNVIARLKKLGDLWADGMKRVNRLPGITGDAAA
jgi:bifunctional non-homologous end joining protein LigD